MHELAITVFEVLIPVLASVLTALAAIVLKKLQKKFDVELTAKENESVKTLIRDGIASAEEWAARKANLKDGSVASGREKAHRVISLVKDVFPKITDNEVAMLIDAEVARTEGLGATNKSINV